MKTLLLWLLCLPAFAQEAPLLRGLVLDADTHQPIPNAQIGIAGNKLGTSTNQEGRFALRVPAAYAATELEIALLGYRRYVRPLPPLPGPELRIELKSSPASLGTVAVSSSVMGIIKEAVARIPRNYPTRPTQLTGFFRESDDNVTSHQYYYLGEALLEVQKAGYQHPRDDGQVKILQLRRVDLRPARPDGAGLVPINWIAGSFIPHRFDFVHNRPEFIQEAHFKDTSTASRPKPRFRAGRCTSLRSARSPAPTGSILPASSTLMSRITPFWVPAGTARPVASGAKACYCLRPPSGRIGSITSAMPGAGTSKACGITRWASPWAARYGGT
jgi:hypothetical protein